MGPDRGNMGGIPKLQCSFLQETDKYSGLCEQERYRDGAPMRWLPKGQRMGAPSRFGSLFGFGATPRPNSEPNRL